MTLRALGYDVDTPDPRDRPMEALLARGEGLERTAGVAFDPLDKPSHRHVRGRRMWQRRAGACVAFGTSRGLHLSQRLQLEPGAPVPELPAPGFIYPVGRLQQYAGLDPNLPRPPITDTGMRPRLALGSTRAVGFCPESSYPYSDDPTRINATPTPRAYRDAYDQRGLDFFRVYETEHRRSDVTAAGMKQRMPHIFGMRVDKAFLAHRSSAAIDSIDPNEIVSGHMLCVLEVLDNGDVLFDNWWDDWGFEDGFGILSRRLFGSPMVTDTYGLRWVPNYSG